MILAENIVHFARALREAGIPVGPDRVLDGLRALAIIGVERREDFYWTLASVFLSRREQFELFDKAFSLFWRERSLLERAPQGLPAAAPANAAGKTPNRIAEAFGLTKKVPVRAERQEDEPDAMFSASNLERMRRRDFES